MRAKDQWQMTNYNCKKIDDQLIHFHLQAALVRHEPDVELTDDVGDHWVEGEVQEPLVLWVVSQLNHICQIHWSCLKLQKQNEKLKATLGFYFWFYDWFHCDWGGISKPCTQQK